MRILGLIPARGGSKGVPRKNIKSLHGKPLIEYSIEAGLACPLIEELVVSTDDEEIANVALKAGAKVPFMRPKILASDAAPTIDTVIHALNFLEAEDTSFDAVCLLQPTVPFREKTDLKDAIENFITSQADSLISVRAVPHIYNPHWVYQEDTATGFLKLAVGEASVITRRQALPKAYHRDGSVYLTKTEVILAQKSLYGKKIVHHIMTASPNINIDTLEDWAMAEQYAKNRT
ncbi:MAG: acylneuraminate cytidylyltransferase family protein [Bacteroidota bacterium]